MKYKFIGVKKVEIGELGIVEPGQVFEVNNPRFEEFVFKSKQFEIVKDKVIKIKKEGD